MTSGSAIGIARAYGRKEMNEVKRPSGLKKEPLDAQEVKARSRDAAKAKKIIYSGLIDKVQEGIKKTEDLFHWGKDPSVLPKFEKMYNKIEKAIDVLGDRLDDLWELFDDEEKKKD